MELPIPNRIFSTAVAPDARERIPERIPTGLAERLGPIILRCIANDSTGLEVAINIDSLDAGLAGKIQGGPRALSKVWANF